MDDEQDLKKYLEAIEARSALGEQDSMDTVDEDANLAASRQAQQQADAQALDAKSAASMSQGGELQKVGNATMAGGAVGGNPYVAGAGLALSTVGMVDSAVRNAEQAKIDAYNKKIMAQRSAIRNNFA